MTTKRTCPGCGKSFTGRSNKIFCDNLCGAKHRQRSKSNGSNAVTADTSLVARIIGENFYLAALDEELALLAKSKNAARAALETTLRKTILASPEWPHSVAGRCALVLWLLDHPGAEHGRFHHLFERPSVPGKTPISGVVIRAGLGKVGSGV